MALVLASHIAPEILQQTQLHVTDAGTGLEPYRHSATCLSLWRRGFLTLEPNQDPILTDRPPFFFSRMSSVHASPPSSPEPLSPTSKSLAINLGKFFDYYGKRCKAFEDSLMASCDSRGVFDAVKFEHAAQFFGHLVVSGGLPKGSFITVVTDQAISERLLALIQILLPPAAEGLFESRNLQEFFAKLRSLGSTHSTGGQVSAYLSHTTDAIFSDIATNPTTALTKVTEAGMSIDAAFSKCPLKPGAFIAHVHSLTFLERLTQTNGAYVTITTELTRNIDMLSGDTPKIVGYIKRPEKLYNDVRAIRRMTEPDGTVHAARAEPDLASVLSGFQAEIDTMKRLLAGGVTVATKRKAKALGTVLAAGVDSVLELCLRQLTAHWSTLPSSAIRRGRRSVTSGQLSLLPGCTAMVHRFL